MTGNWEMRCLLKTAYPLFMCFTYSFSLLLVCLSSLQLHHFTLLFVRILAQHHQDFSVSWGQLSSAPHHHKQIASFQVESCSICRFCMSSFRPNQTLPDRSYVCICTGVSWVGNVLFIHHNCCIPWQLSGYIEGDVVKGSSHPTHVLIVCALVSISMLLYTCLLSPFPQLQY